jgi:hypothetical protein
LLFFFALSWITLLPHAPGEINVSYVVDPSNKEEHKMNRLASQFISSMQGLLGLSLPEEGRTAFRIEDIRQAMLDSLGDEGCASYPHIERRVLFAPDLQGLWYLRSDIMVAISSLQGEVVASQRIRQITGMFEGLLPRGMVTRPGATRR